ncbi:MAG: hypothetical protein WCX65_05345 [bacterium]
MNKLISLILLLAIGGAAFFFYYNSRMAPPVKAYREYRRAACVAESPDASLAKWSLKIVNRGKNGSDVQYEADQNAVWIPEQSALRAATIVKTKYSVTLRQQDGQWTVVAEDVIEEKSNYAENRNEWIDTTQTSRRMLQRR